MQEQFHRNEQNRRAYDAPAQDQAYQSRAYGGGTSVMGEPTNPSGQQSGQGYAGGPAQDMRAYPASDGSYVSPQSGGSGAASFPSSNSQMPGHPMNTSQQSPTGDGPHPYVQTTSIPQGSSKSPMDTLTHVFNKWGKKADDVTGNMWGHLRTGPNVTDTAIGRIAVVSKAMSEGGMENVFRQSFDVAPDEHLRKSYACYLSTSSGLVAGTLYISTHKLAFCSDRPLAIPGASSPTEQNASTEKHGKHSHSKKTSAAQQQQQQQEMVYYKVTVPVSQLESVHPSENLQKKPPEKYIQVKTIDGHEFWFMGFVNYEKGVKNLQDTLASKDTSAGAGNVDPAEAAAMGGTSTRVGYTPASSEPRDAHNLHDNSTFQETTAPGNRDPAEAAATRNRTNPSSYGDFDRRGHSPAAFRSTNPDESYNPDSNYSTGYGRQPTNVGYNGEFDSRGHGPTAFRSTNPDESYNPDNNYSTGYGRQPTNAGYNQAYDNDATRSSGPQFANRSSDPTGPRRDNTYADPARHGEFNSQGHSPAAFRSADADRSYNPDKNYSTSGRQSTNTGYSQAYDDDATRSSDPQFATHGRDRTTPHSDNTYGDSASYEEYNSKGHNPAAFKTRDSTNVDGSYNPDSNYSTASGRQSTNVGYGPSNDNYATRSSGPPQYDARSSDPNTQPPPTSSGYSRNPSNPDPASAYAEPPPHHSVQ